MPHTRAHSPLLQTIGGIGQRYPVYWTRNYPIFHYNYMVFLLLLSLQLPTCSYHTYFSAPITIFVSQKTEVISQPYEKIPSALSWIFSRPDNHNLSIPSCISKKSGQSVSPQSPESPQRSTEMILFHFSAHIPIMRCIYSLPFSSHFSLRSRFFFLCDFPVNLYFIISRTR